MNTLINQEETVVEQKFHWWLITYEAVANSGTHSQSNVGYRSFYTDKQYFGLKSINNAITELDSMMQSEKGYPPNSVVIRDMTYLGHMTHEEWKNS